VHAHVSRFNLLDERLRDLHADQIVELILLDRGQPADNDLEVDTAMQHNYTLLSNIPAVLMHLWLLRLRA